VKSVQCASSGGRSDRRLYFLYPRELFTFDQIKRHLFSIAHRPPTSVAPSMMVVIRSMAMDHGVNALVLTVTVATSLGRDFDLRHRTNYWDRTAHEGAVQPGAVGSLMRRPAHIELVVLLCIGVLARVDNAVKT
jgi:hypothetical protein